MVNKTIHGSSYMSRMTRADTIGRDVGVIRGSLYEGESAGPPGKTRLGCRM